MRTGTLLRRIFLATLLVGSSSCTFFADTDVPEAEMEPTAETVGQYEECNTDLLVCDSQTDCVALVNGDESFGSFCSVACVTDEDCPGLEETPGRCVLGFVGRAQPERCALTCDRSQAGTVEGCPTGLLCTEARGLFICI